LVGAIAAPLGGVAALLAGWTLVGVTALLLGVAFLLGSVASFQNGWTLLGVPFLLLGVAALLADLAAFLGGWTQVEVPFLLLGVAALLSGVALLYRPDSPQRLVAWVLAKPVTRNRKTGQTDVVSDRFHRELAAPS
jgi:hypothetical protein